MRLDQAAAAAEARFPASAIGRERPLEIATSARGVAIVAKRGAACRNRLREHGYDARVQEADACIVHLRRASRRIDPRAPACLVRVDVPEADNDPLVHEHLLHRLSRYPKKYR